MDAVARDRPDRPARVRARAGGLARQFAVWLVVALAAAFGLRVADAVPRVALRLPRGVVRAPDVAQLERASGRRMPVPAFYPDAIEWPPVEARYDSRGSAAIWCRQRPGGGIVLIVATAPPAAPAVGDAVLPVAHELQREEASLGGRPAVVSRVRDEEGVVWQQVQWKTPSQIILMRYRGTLDHLLSLAGSVHE